MREKLFNCLVRRSLENLIVIALFFVLGAFQSVCLASTATSMGEAGTIPAPVPTALTPVWCKLLLSGNTVSCFYGLGVTAPTVWKEIGKPQTINFINNPILVGLYMTSGGAGFIGSGTIDNFSITPAPTYRLGDYDIGAPQMMGSANLINGVWNLSGSGSQMSGTFDQCNFQSWLVWGDCTVICRATSFISPYYFQRMGIMIRDGFNSGSDCALFAVKKSGGVDFEYRTNFYNNADITEFIAPPAPGVKSSVAVGYGLTGGTSYTLRP